VAKFFSDLSGLPTHDSFGKRTVTLACDFNIHVDHLNDQNAKSFLDILSAIGLPKHIKDSMHCGGHTLYLLISHDAVPCAVIVSPLHLFDH